MSLLHFRCKERRRTVRVSLTVPLTINGQTGEGEKFSVVTQSQSVNKHGVMFTMEQVVAVGQQLVLVNDHTAKSMECVVVAACKPTKSPIVAAMVSNLYQPRFAACTPWRRTIRV